LLGFTLVAACLAAAIAPALSMAQAAPPPVPAFVSEPPGGLVISSFRFAGSAGSTDEYVEIFNRSACGTAAIPLNNYELRAKSGSLNLGVIYTFPAVNLNPGEYYLVHGAQFTSAAPGGTAPIGNAAYDQASTDIDNAVGSVALFDGGGAGANQLDAAGYDPDGYVEGTELTPPNNVDRGYFRDMASGNLLYDSNNNIGDFVARDIATAWVGACGIPPDVTISGTITVGSTALSGVTLSYFDTTAKSVTTNASGAYTITVPANWSGTVTPTKAGYSFTPPSAAYTNVTTNPTQNYAASAASTFNPRVIINEVAWNGTISNTAADWIELYNPTDSEQDLSGWIIEAQDGLPAIDLTGTIPAGGFYLVARTGNSDFATHTPTPQASPACLVFRPSDGVTINQYFTGDLELLGETLYLVNPNNLVEDYANRNGGPWPAGSTSNSRSMERHGVTPDSDVVWFTYNPNPLPTSFVHDCSGNRVYGTPGRANWAGTVTATPSATPTRYRTPTPQPPTPFGHMVINEFLPRAGYDWNQDGSVDVYDEFVELYNLGPINATLSGWKIDVISPGGNTSYSLSGTLKPGERMLFYGLKTNLQLHDLGGTVRLINSRGVIIDARGYDPVRAPDESTCRIPEGQYWTFPCFPTPGNENSRTGTHPAAPPAIASQPPPCVMSDVIPAPFRQAECHPFGADVFNPAYWDDQAGFQQFTVRDARNKWRAVVE
jgi:hypothetical protein